MTHTMIHLFRVIHPMTHLIHYMTHDAHHEPPVYHDTSCDTWNDTFLSCFYVLG